MTTITFTIELPDDLAKQASATEFFNSERFITLVENEMQRVKALDEFLGAAALVRAAAASEYAHLTEEEMMALVETEIHAMRDEEDDNSLPFGTNSQ